MWVCMWKTKPSVEEFWRKMPWGVLHAGLDFSSVLEYRKTGLLLVTFKVAGITEGNKSFIHWLIRLMCGTHDDPDESPQSIVK